MSQSNFRWVFPPCNPSANSQWGGSSLYREGPIQGHSRIVYTRRFLASRLQISVPNNYSEALSLSDPWEIGTAPLNELACPGLEAKAENVKFWVIRESTTLKPGNLIAVVNAPTDAWRTNPPTHYTIEMGLTKHAIGNVMGTENVMLAEIGTLSAAKICFCPFSLSI